ncbi:hypothetical protein KP509_04G078800 [Ceratopteris richardii]|uniref:cysteine dioxygenase n=1 Tax=Ceratopteris richardii TaxID=49495 RepID=A0A8T2V0V3_CERRI|nr:hypothetical protein KP509_04G078800 [Ceratopteris richardii]
MHEGQQPMLSSDESEETMSNRGTAVQKLFDSCRATFTCNAGSFQAQALQRIRSILDVGLEDDGTVQHNNQSSSHLRKINGRRGKVSPPISYIHLHESEDFSMGIFCLPKSAVIPLHNHPGMTVMSKLLYGSMHVKAYDWVDHSDVTYPRLAKLVVDCVMSAPCESTILYPKSGGNMHVFTAISPCAVLDVLAPPYSSEDGRHCTYFRALPFRSQAGKSLIEEQRKELSLRDLVWMEEFKPPSDFTVKRAPYKGPAIIYKGDV